MNSPFACRSMIEDPAQFFGRTAEKQTIFNALAAAKPQCVAIVGERRIGRSSLLKNVEQVYGEHLPAPDRYRFAYLDLRRDTYLTPGEFYAQAAKALLGVRHSELSPGQFDDLLDTHNPDGTTKYVLLLDEFNELQERKEHFDDDFYDGLRSRADAGDITYLLVSHIPLEEVAAAHNFGSTFFGIFTHVTLGPFTYNEAHASVLRPTNSQLTDADFALIMQIVDDAYHPLKLNLAAHLLWNARRAGQTELDMQRLEEAYATEAAHQFGASVRQLRSQKQRRQALNQAGRGVKQAVEWFFEDKRYLLPGLILIILLVAFDVVSCTQLGEWVGIPAATATPVPSPVATPIP